MYIEKSQAPSCPGPPDGRCDPVDEAPGPPPAGIYHLSMEIVQNIINHLDEEKLSRYATVSPRFQVAAERHTFRALRLDSRDIEAFRSIMTKGWRRAFLQTLYFKIGSAWTTDDAASYSGCHDRTGALYNIFAELSSWEPMKSSSRRLSLDITLDNSKPTPDYEDKMGSYAPWPHPVVASFRSLHIRVFGRPGLSRSSLAWRAASTDIGYILGNVITVRDVSIQTKQQFWDRRRPLFTGNDACGFLSINCLPKYGFTFPWTADANIRKMQGCRDVNSLPFLRAQV